MKRSEATNTQQDTANVIPMADRLQRYTVAETCRILKMGRTKLWQRFTAGEIKGQRDGGRLYFTAEQIAAYQARLTAP